eukprot:1149623-Pelagomonas_calceolata.AAC.3
MGHVLGIVAVACAGAVFELLCQVCCDGKGPMANMQLANAFDVPVSELHGGRRPRRGGGDDEEEEEEEEEEDDDEQEGPAEIRPPEPSAQVGCNAIGSDDGDDDKEEEKEKEEDEDEDK